ncbi:hypothetical protein [Agarilytica rhodophyticola]|uniref:hypothetical protein n=1 Tax=Agarilytica rhodophyticola TaxID=1737490 RepID=UPI000B3478B5|nr:hypothetical protein [Agarilytica rhodophyticola]
MGMFAKVGFNRARRAQANDSAREAQSKPQYRGATPRNPALAVFKNIGSMLTGRQRAGDKSANTGVIQQRPVATPRSQASVSAPQAKAQYQSSAAAAKPQSQTPTRLNSDTVNQPPANEAEVRIRQSSSKDSGKTQNAASKTPAQPSKVKSNSVNGAFHRKIGFVISTESNKARVADSVADSLLRGADTHRNREYNSAKQRAFESFRKEGLSMMAASEKAKAPARDVANKAKQLYLVNAQIAVNQMHEKGQLTNKQKSDINSKIDMHKNVDSAFAQAIKSDGGKRTISIKGVAQDLHNIYENTPPKLHQELGKEIDKMLGKQKFSKFKGDIKRELVAARNAAKAKAAVSQKPVSEPSAKTVKQEPLAKQAPSTEPSAQKTVEQQPAAKAREPIAKTAEPKSATKAQESVAKPADLPAAKPAKQTALNESTSNVLGTKRGADAVLEEPASKVPRFSEVTSNILGTKRGADTMLEEPASKVAKSSEGANISGTKRRADTILEEPASKAAKFDRDYSTPNMSPEEMKALDDELERFADEQLDGFEYLGYRYIGKETQEMLEANGLDITALDDAIKTVDDEQDIPLFDDNEVKQLKAGKSINDIVLDSLIEEEKIQERNETPANNPGALSKAKSNTSAVTNDDSDKPTQQTPAHRQQQPTVPANIAGAMERMKSSFSSVTHSSNDKQAQHAATSNQGMNTTSPNSRAEVPGDNVSVNAEQASPRITPNVAFDTQSSNDNSENWDLASRYSASAEETSSELSALFNELEQDKAAAEASAKAFAKMTPEEQNRVLEEELALDEAGKDAMLERAKQAAIAHDPEAAAIYEDADKAMANVQKVNDMFAAYANNAYTLSDDELLAELEEELKKEK